MNTGAIRAYKKNKGYEAIPRELLQTELISLEAIGLLCHLQSYPENWTLYKTELYTRFKYNKRTSIQRMWKELVENRFMLEFKKRVGKKWIYQYIFSLEQFPQEEIDSIAKELSNDGFFWDVGFEQSKMDSPKPTPNRTNIKENQHKREPKEDYSQSSYSSLGDDDDNKNITNTLTLMLEIFERSPKLKPLAENLLKNGLDQEEVLKIIQYLNTLDLNNPTILRLINAQLEINKEVAETQGLTDYAAFFLKGMQLKLENKTIEIEPLPIQTEPLPQLTMHNWLENYT